MGCKATTVRDPQAPGACRDGTETGPLKVGAHQDVSGPVSELSVQLHSGKPNHLRNAHNQASSSHDEPAGVTGKAAPSQPRTRAEELPAGASGVAPSKARREAGDAARPDKGATADEGKPKRSSQPAVPPLPTVPTSSWYAKPFTEAPANTAITDFHYQNKGRVVFAKRPIPLAQADLVKLPNRMPATFTEFEIGKDLLYGVGFLHNTPLYIEHHWRSRVAHVENVKKGRVQLPPVVLKREQQRQKAMATVIASGYADTDQAGEDAVRKGSASGTKIALKMERGESTVYNHPYFDMLVGLKVFIDDELIPDHYPTLRSIPQCTATIDTVEAVNHWVSVPFVLMGYLNHPMLDVISLYRTLSLTFVEHLLRLKPAKGQAESEVQQLSLRVEVVYGCRAEAYFCTEFISRGTCTVTYARANKPALKSYEEKLRALILAHRSANQIIRAPSTSSRRVRACVMCGYPLAYRCTVCGAELCASPMCSNHAFAGYPTGCSYHKPAEYA